MSIDPYSVCPGGSGKKVKFCCPDLVSELDKLDGLVTAGQAAAAAAHAGRLLENFPDRACLLSFQSRLLRQSGNVAASHEALSRLADRDPANPLALAEQALRAADDDLGPTAAIDAMQRALEASCHQSPRPELVLDALIRVGEYLLDRGEIWAGRTHLIAANRLRPESEAVQQLLASLSQSTQVSLLLKAMPGYFDGAQTSAPWYAEFERGVLAYADGRIEDAACRFEQLVEEYPHEPLLWRELAHMRANLADRPRAIAALRLLAALPLPLDDRVEAEALAQTYIEQDLAGTIEIVAAVYTVNNGDDLLKNFADSTRLTPMPGDPRDRPDTAGVPPRAMFRLLDRPKAATGVDISLHAVPRVLAELFVFGRQTNHEARVEVQTYRDPRFAEVQKAVADAGGPALGPRVDEVVLGKTATGMRSLSVELQFPDDTPLGHRVELMEKLQREIMFEVWPHTPREVLGRRTPAEAAADSNLQVEALAAILLLEASQSPSTLGLDLNVLREKLGLPRAATIEFGDKQMQLMPLVRLARIDAAKLTDVQLEHLHYCAAIASALQAVRRSATEMLARPQLHAKYPADMLHGELARVETDPRRALPHLEHAVAAAKKAGRSPAHWYFDQVPLRLAVGEFQEASDLLKKLLTEHGAEPGVREAVGQLLHALGLKAASGPQPETAEIAPESGGETHIWTPGDPEPGAGGKKSPLWVPGMG